MANPPVQPAATHEEHEEPEEAAPVGYATRVALMFQADQDFLAEVVGVVVTFGSGAMALAAVLMGGSELTEESDEDPITETLAAFLPEPENAPVLARRDGHIVLTLYNDKGHSAVVEENHGDFLVGVRIVDVRDVTEEEAARLTQDDEDAEDE